MTWIGVDGEEVAGKYVILSNGEKTLKNFDGLSTSECLEFLLSNRDVDHVAIYGLNYDVNHWLRDLKPYELRKLWDTEQVIWTDYKIIWTPGKKFWVEDIYKRKVEVIEAFGFFQCSFVRALEAWDVPVANELREMKYARKDFSEIFTDSNREKLEQYCEKECQKLSQLMEAFERKCIQLGMRLSTWRGTGSLGAALMRNYKVKRFCESDSDLFSDSQGVGRLLTAYYGGRNEVFAQGTFSDVQTIDINSAYPWALSLCDNLNGGYYKLIDDCSKLDEKSLVHCKWKDLQGRVMPLPIRDKREILWPKSGEGWYHGVEVQAAIFGGFDIELLEMYEWVPGEYVTRCFDWLNVLYSKRRLYDIAGDPSGRILKLGMNSLYGKLVQSLQVNGKTFGIKSFVWAGQLTARIRARMLQLALCGDPLMISTDGIFYRKSDRMITSETLGGLSGGILDEVFIAQSGVYRGERAGEEILRSRGFFGSDIDFDELEEGWERCGPEFEAKYKSRRFVGVGSSLREKPSLGRWRQWVDQDRTLSLRVKSKVYNGCDLLPPDGPFTAGPYVPKVGGLRDSPDELLDGMDQKMEVLL